ncbi:MAG: ABC transporter permease [Cyanobacteria bacterium REEB459]|nr:ABC transporter permease [Cyanobacteria bacterium REEB459]
MLGIIIGIAAVIAVVTIGRGAQAETESQLKSLGSNLIYVRSGVATIGAPASQGAGSATTLNWQDARAIVKGCEAVKNVAPTLGSRAQVVWDSHNTQTYLTGTTPDFMEVRDFLPLTGRFFNIVELDQGSRVALIGQTVGENLGLTATTALGQTLRIRGEAFTIIGTLEYKGSNSFRDQDDQVIIPLTTMARRIVGINAIRGISLDSIVAAAKSPDQVEAAQFQITNLLRLRHGIVPPQTEDFTVRNQADLVSASSSVSKIFTILLGGAAAISLVVGGIGIMNIMLVSVTERTREIGLRRALGARSGDILQQFLWESIVLSMVGGALGIGLGVGISVLINLALGWRVPIPLDAVLASLGVCGVVGVFFGAYPAQKASLLDPIAALRSN